MSAWWPLQEGEVYVEAGRPAEHWVLRMTAEFSSVQLVIEHMLGSYLGRQSPALGRKITKKHLSRLTDEDRWDYVKALTADVGYTGSGLPQASDLFWRCKRVRDLVGHHPAGMDLVRSQERPDYHYSVPSDTRSGSVPDPLTPSTFRQLGAECRWLVAFLHHIGYLGGQVFISPAAKVDDEGTPRPQYIEILEPPPLPVPPDWEIEGLSRPLTKAHDRGHNTYPFS